MKMLWTSGCVPCAGLDSADLISQLRASHAHDPQSRLGVDVLSGGAGDMDRLGIFEAFKVGPARIVCHISLFNAPGLVLLCSHCPRRGQRATLLS